MAFGISRVVPVLLLLLLALPVVKYAEHQTSKDLIWM
jgi:hypothetical protein